MKTRYPAGTRVVVHLIPAAPLLDGSAEWPLDAVLTPEMIWQGSHFGGIPYTVYRATAEVVLPSGRIVPCRLGVSGIQARPVREIVLTFPIKHDQFLGATVEVPWIAVTDEP